MKIKYIILLMVSISLLQNTADAQEKINQLNKQGLKEGRWIVKYDNGNPKYNGFFQNGSPVGDFIRYYDSGEVSARLNYREKSDSVYAVFYHLNGFISSRGCYINMAKEGKWEYFSQYIEDYMVGHENYVANLRDGPSLKYHWNGNLAEKLFYISDRREGEWIQNYSNGVLALKAFYSEDKLNGSFEAFTLDGKPMMVGLYREDIRTGEWTFYDKEGQFISKTIYRNGEPENKLDLLKSANDLLDELERKGGIIEDPSKTGIIW